MKEKILNKKSNGLIAFIITTMLYLVAVAGMIFGAEAENWVLFGISTAWVCIGWIPYLGLRVLKPQEAIVLTLFGKYIGTLKKEGFYCINPFCSSVNPASNTKLSQSGDVNIAASPLIVSTLLNPG